MASGDVLTWLDDDDYLAPGALHALALALFQTGADVIAGACQLHRDGEPGQQHLTSYARGPLRLDEVLDLEHLWLPNPFLYQPGMVFTRSLWQQAGACLSSECSSSMAYDLWLRFALHGAHLHVIGHPVVWTRMDESWTTGDIENQGTTLAKVRERFLREHGYCWKQGAPRGASPKQRWVLVNDRAFEYGAGIAHRRAANVLRQAGHEVRLVATNRIPQDRSRAVFVAEAIDSIARYEPEIVMVGNLHGAPYAVEVLEGISRRFETVVVLHDFWFLTGRCIYPGASRRYLDGCDETCDCPYAAPDIQAKSIRDAWNRKWTCLREAKRLSLFTISEWMAGRVREALAARESSSEMATPTCHWLKCGLELQRFLPRDRALCRELLGLPRDRFIILTSTDSMSDSRKGLSDLASALEQLQLQDCLVVSPGRLEGDEELPIPGMRTLGYVRNRTKMALLFAAADIFVGASLDETFGQVFVEAASCGTPSIGYPVGGIPEALVHGVTGLLAAGVGPRHLADCIDELYRDPRRRSDLGRLARLHAENEWSCIAAYHQLVQALRSAGVAQRMNLSPQIVIHPCSPEWHGSSQAVGLLNDLCEISGTQS